MARPTRLDIERSGTNRDYEGEAGKPELGNDHLLVSKVWGQDWELLRAGHGNGALGAAPYFARNHSDRTLRELGQLAGGIQYPAVAMAIRRFGKRLESDKA